MIVALLCLLIGLLSGLYWGERSRRLDLLHVRRYQEERPPSSLLMDGLALVAPPQTGDHLERDISTEAVQATARFLRDESQVLGRTLTPEEAERQAKLMLAGQDV